MGLSRGDREGGAEQVFITLGSLKACIEYTMPSNTKDLASESAHS